MIPSLTEKLRVENLFYCLSNYFVSKIKSSKFFRQFCERNGIVMIAFSPFGSPDLPWGEKLPHILDEDIVKEIGEHLKRSPALVVLRWLLQRKLATIPKVKNLP
jgi:diketogulonate reductase-like aldo/keto reductase